MEWHTFGSDYGSVTVNDVGTIIIVVPHAGVGAIIYMPMIDGRMLEMQRCASFEDALEFANAL